MKYNYLYCLICIIFLILSQNGYADEKQLVITSDMQYQYASALFDKKDFDTAVIEFKRFIHFFPDNEKTDQAEFNIAVCLFNLKKYHDAARAFNDIIIRAKENDFTKEAVFYQSRSFMKIGNTGYAQIVLQNYLKLADDPITKNRIYINLVQLHLEEARNAKPGALDLAEKYLSKISYPGTDKYNVDQYADMIFKARHLPKKNPGTAGLAAVIPGGGFLYCERYHDALITFLLNTGLMAAAYRAYENDNKALAGVIAFVETGFYTGNIYGSISSAHKHNQARLIHILNEEFSITPKFDPKKKSIEISFNHKF